MNISNTKLRSKYIENGFVVIKIDEIREQILYLKKIFENTVHKNFNKNVTRNRNLIKRFTSAPSVMSIFQSLELLNLLKDIADIKNPVYCGPIVSHYTSNDETGGGYGLPWHQDYPSMASSKKSVVCWVAMSESGPDTHGLNILSGHHKTGLLKGDQRDKGYEVHYDRAYDESQIIPEMRAGDLIIMSSFTPHRTYCNDSYMGWKLSFSARFDCLDDEEWEKRDFVNAYNIEVDRQLYLE